MAEIKIDAKLFHERVSHFISAWKTDKRASDNGVFAGASSIVIMMGKVEENPEFHKNNAMHVCYIRRLSSLLVAFYPRGLRIAQLLTLDIQFWLLGYEFPTTLMLFTTEKLYIVTTAKKGTVLNLSALSSSRGWFID